MNISRFLNWYGYNGLKLIKPDDVSDLRWRGIVARMNKDLPNIKENKDLYLIGCYLKGRED